MAQGLLSTPFTFTESIMFLLRGFIEFCDVFFGDEIISVKLPKSNLFTWIRS